MPQIPVDLTGIANGETLVYSNGTLVRGPLSAPPIVGANLAALGEPTANGIDGIIQGGSGSLEWDYSFRWDLATGRWVGEVFNVMRVLDGWALDWKRQPLVAVRSPKWARPNGGVGWQRSGPRLALRSDLTVPGSGSFTINVKDVGIADMPSSGWVAARGLIFAYAGKTTGTGTATLTGCTVVSGTTGVTLKADMTPLIPYAPFANGGGDPGGWGCVPSPFPHAGELWAAGFRPQLRISGLMNGTFDEKAGTVALFFQNYNLGEDTNYVSLTSDTTGLLGPIVPLVGPTDPHAGIGGGGGNVEDERSFEWGSPEDDGWQAWTGGTITDSVLYPILFGQGPADIDDTWEAYRVTADIRWVGTP